MLMPNILYTLPLKRLEVEMKDLDGTQTKRFKGVWLTDLVMGDQMDEWRVAFTENGAFLVYFNFRMDPVAGFDLVETVDEVLYHPTAPTELKEDFAAKLGIEYVEDLAV